VRPYLYSFDGEPGNSVRRDRCIVIAALLTSSRKNSAFAQKWPATCHGRARLSSRAQTIADLAGAEQIDTAQISEAMSLRKLDRSESL